jgi:cytidylate kinase
MIITISGKAGSGKSSVAKEISKRLNLKHYSVGDVMREMAKEKGVSLLELNKQAEKDPRIDKELDDRLIKLGKTEDNFVIDGRLTAFFIPHAQFRVFLDADENTRAERILNAQRKDEKHASLKETMANIEKRETSEKKRYKEYYDVDYSDPKLYTSIIDTKPLGLLEVVDRIASLAAESKNNNKHNL